MSLRPTAAHWFELLTSREELGATLDCLARTHSVQLQAYSQTESRLPLRDLRRVLDEYETLARRFRPWWPAAQLPDRRRARPDRSAAGRAAAAAAVGRGRGTGGGRTRTVALERTALGALARLCAAARPALPRLDRLAGAGPLLASRIYALPPGTPALALPPALIAAALDAGTAATSRTCSRSARRRTCRNSTARWRHARCCASRCRPTCRRPSPPSAATLATRRDALDARERAARDALAQLDATHGLPAALGELALAAWIVTHVPELPVTEHFAWVTGWCADRDDCSLRAALDARGLHYLLRFAARPRARWRLPSCATRAGRGRSRSSTGMMGVPAAGDADPSLLVAILAPLLFGFMFGDVAQGAIVALGRLRCCRQADARAAPAGAGRPRRDRLRPRLRQRVRARGRACPRCGCIRWSSRCRCWAWRSASACDDPGRPAARRVAARLARRVAALAAVRRGPAVVAYLGIARRGRSTCARCGRCRSASPGSLGGRGAGAARGRACRCSGRARRRESRAPAAAGRQHDLVRARRRLRARPCRPLHAPSSASPRRRRPGLLAVLVLGNAAIIALEGLVVSIQTTRLVLFEFFIRFLTARGRPFEPLHRRRRASLSRRHAHETAQRAGSSPWPTFTTATARRRRRSR